MTDGEGDRSGQQEKGAEDGRRDGCDPMVIKTLVLDEGTVTFCRRFDEWAMDRDEVGKQVVSHFKLRRCFLMSLAIFLENLIEWSNWSFLNNKIIFDQLFYLFLLCRGLRRDEE